MFAQLGSIVFSGLYGFESLNFDGDEAVFAESEIINNKPRSQKTGDSLQEVSVSIKMHASFCNIKDQLASLKKSKDAGEVLPLIFGTGEYKGDYVIISFPYSVDHAFADGTYEQVTVNLTIKEYVLLNKIEQQQQEARRKAFAVGDKNPVITRPPQPPTQINSVSQHVAAVSQQTSKINDLANQYENNESAREITVKRIKDTCDSINKEIAEVNAGLDEARELQNRFTAIKSAAATVTTAATAIKSMMPPNSISDFRDANRYLQQVTGVFQRVSIPLVQEVILRK